MNDIENALEYFGYGRLWDCHKCPKFEDAECIGDNATCNYYKLAIQALQEKAERENPKPLTLEELKERHGKSVYAISLDGEEENQWGQLKHSLCGTLGIFGEDGLALFAEREYGETWQAYDHEPKEATDDR